MNKEYWDQKLMEYFDGTLSEKETKEVELAIEKEEGVKQMYHDHVMAQRTLEAIEKEELFSHLKELDKEKETDDQKSNFGKGWLIVTIVLALLIIVFTFVKKLNDVEPQMLAMEYSVHDTNSAVRSTDNKISNSELQYQNHLRSGKELMNSGQYEEARKEFEAIEESNIIYSQNKEWMIALTYYLEFGKNHPSFQSTLIKIVSNPSHNNYKKAIAMEEDMNGFWSYFKK